MAIETRIFQTLTDAERRRLFGWGENIFGPPIYQLKWREKDRHLLLYAEDQLVSHAGVLRHAVELSGQSIVLGGVGGVVTVPEAQGQGYASRIMRQAEQFICQDIGADFGLLFCLDRLVPFYVRLGWQPASAPVLIDQPSGKIRSPLRVMVLPCGEREWPSSEVDLCSLPW